MKGNYPDDTFTQTDLEAELDRAGLKHYDKGRYLLAQCPTHDDRNPSVQIYKDDWFVNCHATCGRYHVTKAFPSLREAQRPGSRAAGVRSGRFQAAKTDGEKKVTEHKYKQFDLTDEWLQMQQFINGEMHLHGVPCEVLNSMGWRWADLSHTSIFIPYFSASKGSIPFAQYRHFTGNVRFTMLKDAKPTMYGTWNLDNSKLFLVEGTSDAAVLEYAAVPWIAAPSAASGELVKALARYCKENGITIVFAGDNDQAGSKLREALDEIGPYRVKQPPVEYKDWGEFLEATDRQTVQDYCFEELFGRQEYPSTPEEVAKFDHGLNMSVDNISHENSDLENIQKVWPDAEQVELVGDPKESSKELSAGGSPEPLY